MILTIKPLQASRHRCNGKNWGTLIVFCSAQYDCRSGLSKQTVTADLTKVHKYNVHPLICSFLHCCCNSIVITIGKSKSPTIIRHCLFPPDSICRHAISFCITRLNLLVSLASGCPLRTIQVYQCIS